MHMLITWLYIPIEACTDVDTNIRTNFMNEPFKFNYQLRHLLNNPVCFPTIYSFLYHSSTNGKIV